MNYVTPAKSRLRLTNFIWEQLQPALPHLHRGRPSKKTRNFIEGVIYRFRTGIPWRDLPSDFGPWKSIFNRFNNWSKKGYFLAMFEQLKKNQH